jgi:hypothetical protein
MAFTVTVDLRADPVVIPQLDRQQRATRTSDRRSQATFASRRLARE